MTITIRPLAPNDFPHWLPLWDANNLGERDEDITTETWSRITDPDNSSVNGLAAIHKGELAGIMHYILHPTTGSLRDACYMQDLFVTGAHRKQGIARKMVEELARIGGKEQWARIFWLADETNEAAQALYKNLGVRINFSVHMMLVS